LFSRSLPPIALSLSSPFLIPSGIAVRVVAAPYHDLYDKSGHEASLGFLCPFGDPLAMLTGAKFFSGIILPPTNRLAAPDAYYNDENELGVGKYQVFIYTRLTRKKPESSIHTYIYHIFGCALASIYPATRQIYWGLSAVT